MRWQTHLYKFLLVFMLLFVQQGAAAHAITHTLAEQKKSQAHDHGCELCVADAQFGSALHTPLQALPIREFAAPRQSATLTVSLPQRIFAATARGPPAYA
jgi:hypothetical protein